MLKTGSLKEHLFKRHSTHHLAHHQKMMQAQTGITGLAARIVFKPWFEKLSAFIIILHSFVIGAYVEYEATVDSSVHVSLKVLNQTLVIVFFGEVIVKVLAE